MPIDSVGSYEDLFNDDRVDTLKGIDKSPAAWNGRTVLKTKENHRMHSILENSRAQKTSKSRKRDDDSAVFLNFNRRTFVADFNSNPNFNPFIKLPNAYNPPPMPQYIPPPSRPTFVQPPSLPQYAPSLPQPMFVQPSSLPQYAPSLPQPMFVQPPPRPLAINSGLPPSFDPSNKYDPPQLLNSTNNFSTWNLPPPGAAPLFTIPIHSTPPLNTSPFREPLFPSETVRSGGISTNVYPSIAPPNPEVQTEKIVKISNDESMADFIKGFAQSLPKGSFDSIKEIPSTLSTVTKVTVDYFLGPYIHPLDHLPILEQVSQATAAYETISYLGTCDYGELAKAIAPEAHKLCTNWDNLPYEERGQLIGYCVSKYGTDVLLPVAAGKGVKIAGAAFKEAAAIGKFGGAIGAGITEAKVYSATQGSSKVSNTVRAAETVIGKEATLASPQIIATESTIESLLAKGVEKSPFSRIKAQPNGIWEIEGKNIRKFNSNIFSDENKLNHIFEDSRHQLDQLTLTHKSAFEKITIAIIEVDQAGGIAANQPFVTRVKIDGRIVEVRGVVADGELKIGTFFVPEG